MCIGELYQLLKIRQQFERMKYYYSFFAKIKNGEEGRPCAALSPKMSHKV